MHSDGSAPFLSSIDMLMMLDTNRIGLGFLQQTGLACGRVRAPVDH